MSDKPKPKPGSLRDRIAAFESTKPTTPPQSPSASSQPRTKPGPVSWKPRPPSPQQPVGDNAQGSSEDRGGKSTSGFSVSDARDSISKAGSLRDRMAALQGKGAFGAPSPPPLAPRPASDRPKWRPPPPVIAPSDDDQQPKVNDPAASPPSSPPALSSLVPRALVPPSDPTVSEGHVTQSNEPDEPVAGEDEERQRRAAIAARMARIGGARVGMAPLVFTRKQSTPKPESPVEELPKHATATDNEPSITSAPRMTISQDQYGSQDPVPPIRKESDSTSESPVIPAKVPAAMPVPSVPRRAAPPRKKSAKTPSLTPEEESSTRTSSDPSALSTPDLVKADHSSSADGLEGPRQAPDDKNGGITAPIIAAHEEHASPIPLAREPTLSEVVPSSLPSAETLPEDILSIESRDTSQKETLGDDAALSSSVHQHGEDAEEEGEARRRRVAERLAKMGAFNPLSLPPRRQSSGVSITGTDAPETAVEIPTSPGRREEDDEAASADDAESPIVEEQDTPHEAGQAGVEVEREDPEEEQDERRHVPIPAQSDPSGPVEEHNDEHLDTDRVLTDSSSEYDSEEPELPANEEPEAVRSHEEEDDDDDDKSEYDDDEDAGLPVPSPPAIPVIPPPPPVLNIPPPPPLSDFQRSAAIPAKPTSPRADAASTDQLARPPPPPARFVPPPPAPLQDDTRVVPPIRSGPPPPTPPLPVQMRVEQVEPVFAPPPPIPTRFAPPPPPPPPSLPTHVDEAADEEEEEEEEEEGMREDVETEPEPEPELEPAPIPGPPPRPPRRRPVPTVQVEGEEEILPTPPPPVPRRVGLTPPLPHQLREQQEIGAKILATTPPSVPVSPLIPRRPVSVQLATHEPPVALHDAGEAVEDDEEAESGDASSQDGQQEEVLDESEGDPIDPTFHSPSRRVSMIGSVSPSPSPPSQVEVEAPRAPRAAAAATAAANEEAGSEDAEVIRPKTIAERMAKLGGIRLGGPIPIMPVRPPPAPRVEEGHAEEEGEEKAERGEQEQEEEPEEEEQARKQRIAARMAGLGGMRLGMMPFGAGGAAAAAPRIRREASGDAEPVLHVAARPVPPPRLVPPPPPSYPPVQDADSEQETSEEGVKVEAEDSEIEEVGYEEVEEEGEGEMVPPPIPPRVGRPGRDDAPPMRKVPQAPLARPPVPAPMTPPVRKPSGSGVMATSRKTSGDSQLGAAKRAPASYVMVDEPDVLESDEGSSSSSSSPPLPPPVPPPRPVSRVVPPPSRIAPPPPPPPPPLSESVELVDAPSAHWELPSIPSSSLDFGDDSEDLSTSVWTELSQSGTFNAPPPPLTSATNKLGLGTSRGPGVSEVTMTAEELMAVWGRVGVQVCEVATTLFEQSKKSLIGDGTYEGFVRAVVGQVPNAIVPAPPVYGYVIYVQSGATVQKRASEIMPGDVVLLSDARFKGHKGLQTYTQTVGGAGAAVVGVVSEFEVKKSKIRVFEANQHVGQQTVESVSYRLEDLKSGIVKIFRVLDANE